MGGKKLITESDVRALGRGEKLRLDSETIATPSALDAAFQLGIHIVRGAGGECASSNGARECLWHNMLETEGTYVVEVRGGRATVSRLGPDGPVSFGHDSIEEHGNR